MIDVAVHRVRAGALLPTRAYDGDAGFDLAACEERGSSQASAPSYQPVSP